MSINKKSKLEEIKKHYKDYTHTYLEVVNSAIQSHRSANEELMLNYYFNTMGIKSGMKLLDAGCGICGPAIHFAKKADIKIDAINLSDTQIEITKEKIKKSKLENKINALCGDYHSLKKYYQENSFDIIYFLESYGHCLNHKQLLESSVSVLKKGGLLYIKDYFKKDLTKMKQVNRLAKLMNKKYAYNLPCLYNTMSILRKLNMEIIKIGKPEFEDDGGIMSAEFSDKSNLKLFKEGEEMFSYADIFEIIVRKT
ncbi:MAG TPA: class I SAM-dependent methyltransferase [Bacteroidales bacterium]|nr:class I SAM-dependent methyltransferase [Bacteroidales bacterium]